jgi:hypothetical protein
MNQSKTKSVFGYPRTAMIANDVGQDLERIAIKAKPALEE